MDKKYNIMRETVETKIINGKSFSYDEVREEIINKNGIISFGGYTLGKHLESLEDKNIISYDGHLDKFRVL
jgi:hypothetical protein